MAGMMKSVHMLAQLLVLVGALNWGLVGAFNIDAVEQLVPRNWVKSVYTLVGLAAVYVVACRLL
jgi:uncharacterized membrane protein YuzA (DUF378 family)